jgi:hypothetical protein
VTEQIEKYSFLNVVMVMRLGDAAPLMVQYVETVNLSIQLLLLHSVHLHQIKPHFAVVLSVKDSNNITLFLTCSLPLL